MLKICKKLQEKRFVFVKILAIIIPENGAKVSKIKCLRLNQQTLIIASIARTYYPKTTYVRANAAGGTNGDNHMLYINKSNGVVILNLSTERYYSASFSYLAN